MKELRLDYFLMRGGLLVDNDICLDVHGLKTRILLSDCNWNIEEDCNSKCFIKSFAPRENKGEQPVPDDFPVVVYDVEGDVYFDRAVNLLWCRDEFPEWKPDIDKLIEQQAQYDEKKGNNMKHTYEKVKFDKLSEAFKAHEESPLYYLNSELDILEVRDDHDIISRFGGLFKLVEVKEPKKTVVDAVNHFQSKFPDLYVNKWNNKMSDYYIVFVNGEFFPDDVACNDIVCTKEEFNQCVEDMTEARWMNAFGFACNYETYKEYEINEAHAEALRENMAYDLYAVMYKVSGVTPLPWAGAPSREREMYIMAVDEFGVTVNK